jgi:hypothetical protein
MIAVENVRSMCGLKIAVMGSSFASADTFRRSLSEKCLFMPQETPK